MTEEECLARVSAAVAAERERCAEIPRRLRIDWMEKYNANTASDASRVHALQQVEDLICGKDSR